MYWLLLFYLAHFLFDFSFQSEKEGMGKSSSILWLLSHTANYSMLMYMVMMVFTRADFIVSSHFAIITFILHTITDYFSSRLSKKAYERGHYYGVTGFWSIIGIDQFLHIAQITITLYYLS